MANSLAGGQVLVLTPATTLGSSLELSEPQFAHLLSGDNVCPAPLEGVCAQLEPLPQSCAHSSLLCASPSL